MARRRFQSDINIGDFRVMAIIERRDMVRNERGEKVVGDYTEVARRWCKIKPVSTSETYIGDQEGSTTTHMIEMRHFAGIKASMRIRVQTVSGERLFDINGVMDPGTSHITRVKCKEAGAK